VQVIFFAAHAQADEDDDGEIYQQNRNIDRQPSVHFGGYLATGRLESHRRTEESGNREEKAKVNL